MKVRVTKQQVVSVPQDNIQVIAKAFGIEHPIYSTTTMHNALYVLEKQQAENSNINYHINILV
jgi:hypothetical protein